MSAINTGAALRDSVARLLRIQGHKVEVEARLSATTADVLYVDESNAFFPMKIAIECKDWKTPLTSANLANIDNLYRPSLNSGEIDNLLIVGRHEIAGSPRETLQRFAKTQYKTFSDFRSSLMNFNALIDANIKDFENSYISQNFIAARERKSSNLLESCVATWLGSEKTGLIIYGGYGLGKTTFSTYLAKKYSEDFWLGSSGRIPIRIPLGRMYSKQDVVALVCSALTGAEGGAAVSNFSYPLFVEMNRAGQFILILDGFDEMRHAMDLQDFLYTFESISSLFTGDAKVILLGRPDSFFNGDEEDMILNKLFEKIGEAETKLQIHEIDFFNQKEIETYLQRFIYINNSVLAELSDKSIRLLELFPKTSHDLLRRPVQLKMFTSVIGEALSYTGNLTRYWLYNRFIYQFLYRENQKIARNPEAGKPKRDGRDPRAEFMQSVAWWVLNTKKENRFLTDEIPGDVVPSALRKTAGSVAALREAIVGSVIEPMSATHVLDRKGGKKYYYFPHKSYIEFLAAEYFSNNKFTNQQFVDLMKNMNDEILSFISEGGVAGIENLRMGFDRCVGVVDFQILDVCARDERIVEQMKKLDGFGQPSDTYVFYWYLIKNKSDPAPFLARRIAQARSESSIVAALNCICHRLVNYVDSDIATSLLVTSFTTALISKLRPNNFDLQPIQFLIADSNAIFAAILSRSAYFNKNGSILSIDLVSLQLIIEAATRGGIFVGLPPTSNTRNKAARVLSNDVRAKLDEGWAKIWDAMISSRPGQSPMFPVELSGEAQQRFQNIV